jgi:hypothetical protein
MTSNQDAVKDNIKVKASILKRAISNDQEAIKLIFKQFISEEDEDYYFTEYFGVEGLWGFGTHSFVCLTNLRIATICISPIGGKITYQDGYLEFINSGIIYQPSIIPLYLSLFSTISTAISFLILAANQLHENPFTRNYFVTKLHLKYTILACLCLVIFPILTGLIAKYYHRICKSGLIFHIKDGLSVRIFSNRKFLKKANILFRKVGNIRKISVRDKS